MNATTKSVPIATDQDRDLGYQERMAKLVGLIVFPEHVAKAASNARSANESDVSALLSWCIVEQWIDTTFGSLHDDLIEQWRIKTSPTIDAVTALKIQIADRRLSFAYKAQYESASRARRFVMCPIILRLAGFDPSLLTKQTDIHKLHACLAHLPKAIDRFKSSDSTTGKAQRENVSKCLAALGNKSIKRDDFVKTYFDTSERKGGLGMFVTKRQSPAKTTIALEDAATKALNALATRVNEVDELVAFIGRWTDKHMSDDKPLHDLRALIDSILADRAKASEPVPMSATGTDG